MMRSVGDKVPSKGAVFEEHVRILWVPVCLLETDNVTEQKHALDDGALGRVFFGGTVNQPRSIPTNQPECIRRSARGRSASVQIIDRDVIKAMKQEPQSGDTGAHKARLQDKPHLPVCVVH